MHDGRRTHGDPDTPMRENARTVRLPENAGVDPTRLFEVSRQSDTYLPPHAPSEQPERTGDEPESKLVRRAKLAGLVIAVAALITSVVAATALAQRPSEEHGAAQVPRRTIADIETLGVLGGHRAGAPSPGELVPESTRTNTESATSPSTPATQPTTQTAQAHTTDTEPPTARLPTTSGTQASAPSSPEPSETTGTGTARAYDTTSQAAGTTGPTNKRAVVQRFYERVADDPTSALGMLTPAVLERPLARLLSGWAALDDVRLIDVHERDDGSVRAVVTMLRQDGERLRVTQLLGFADGTRINHVQLLSAQHG